MAIPKYYVRPDGLHETIIKINGKRKAFRGRTDREVWEKVKSYRADAAAGTPAATYPDQVPPEVQSERFGRLLALQSGISGEINAEYLGRKMRVLVDSLSKSGASDIYSGRTDTGKLVHFAATEEDIGQFLTVKIDRTSPFALYGTVQR